MSSVTSWARWASTYIYIYTETVNLDSMTELANSIGFKWPLIWKKFIRESTKMILNFSAEEPSSLSCRIPNLQNLYGSCNNSCMAHFSLTYGRISMFVSHDNLPGWTWMANFSVSAISCLRRAFTALRCVVRPPTHHYRLSWNLFSGFSDFAGTVKAKIKKHDIHWLQPLCLYHSISSSPSLLEKH